MDKLKIRDLCYGDAIKIVEMFAMRGAMVTIDRTSEGLLQDYYTVTIEGNLATVTLEKPEEESDD